MTTTVSAYESIRADTYADAHTSYGTCRGRVIQSGVHLWRGIPYAAVPQRFSHSVKPDAWDGIRDCVKNGKQAVQPTGAAFLKSLAPKAGALMNAVMASSAVETVPRFMSEEQCLNLNIRAPAQTGVLHPVMVWIHGGAFMLGSGSTPLYQGNHLVRHGNVVLVTINYRLGAFGFLNLRGCDSNCGLSDQCMALQWVHEEIRHFGGDPDRVTIFGESAGGMSCGALLSSPRAQPFFQRAILMSGAMSNAVSGEDASMIGHQFCESAQKTPEQLRLLSAEEMLVLQNKFVGVDGVMPFQPCVDGDLLVATPIEAVKRGLVQLSAKQVMIGTTEAEWELFQPSLLPHWLSRSSLKEVSSKAVHSQEELNIDQADQGQIRALLKAIRKDRQLGSWDATMKAFNTMRVFTAPARLAAKALSEKADSVWVYEYAFKAGMLGPCHASELPILFGTFDMHWMLERWTGSKADPNGARSLSDSMAASFAAFARSGSPTDGAALWNKKYTCASPSVYLFDRQPRLVDENLDADSAVNLGMAVVQGQRRPWGIKLPEGHSKL